MLVSSPRRNWKLSTSDLRRAEEKTSQPPCIILPSGADNHPIEAHVVGTDDVHICKITTSSALHSGGSVLAGVNIPRKLVGMIESAVCAMGRRFVVFSCTQKLCALSPPCVAGHAPLNLHQLHRASTRLYGSFCCVFCCFVLGTLSQSDFVISIASKDEIICFFLSLTLLNISTLPIQAICTTTCSIPALQLPVLCLSLRY